MRNFKIRGARQPQLGAVGAALLAELAAPDPRLRFADACAPAAPQESLR